MLLYLLLTYLAICYVWAMVVAVRLWSGRRIGATLMHGARSRPLAHGRGLPIIAGDEPEAPPAGVVGRAGDVDLAARSNAA